MQFVKCVQLVCLFVTALNLIHVSANRHSHREKLNNFKKNEQHLRQEGKCEPKIRLQSIDYHPDAQIGAMYFPPVAVLHVCDKTGGCCYQSTHQCKPSEEEEVEIVFSYKRIGEPRTHFQTFTFVNHTQCACIDTNEPPR